MKFLVAGFDDCRREIFKSELRDLFFVIIKVKIHGELIFDEEITKEL